MTALVWFRDDLRIADNPALHAALANSAKHGGRVIAVYILETDTRPLGAAAKWWLHHSLLQLGEALASLGVPLTVVSGSAKSLIPELVSGAACGAVYWNRRYGVQKDADRVLRQHLENSGVCVNSFIGNLLVEPWQISTAQGAPYRVFGAFWRSVSALPPPPTVDIPAPATELPGSADKPKFPAENSAEDIADSDVNQARLSREIAALGLLPEGVSWTAGLAARWQPGEAAAQQQLHSFLDGGLRGYEKQRDYPAISATSELSPHLRWGEISPRTVLNACLARSAVARSTAEKTGIAKFLSELGWREFAWHTLFHNPSLATDPLDSRFYNMPYLEPEAAGLRAWQRGETGFALVDAGMRELRETGFMHNRVRMVTASFLTKHMLCDWRVGEAWFWDTLVDADPASNPFNWQWVAGCGVDSAPYFRIFNPESQQKRFDPAGEYVKLWCGDAAEQTERVLDLPASRMRALAAYQSIK